MKKAFTVTAEMANFKIHHGWLSTNFESNLLTCCSADHAESRFGSVKGLKL